MPVIEQNLSGDAVAVFSECRQYRYFLERRWARALKPCTFLMLNPSTADALVDDPTIRRCMHFARRLGSGSLRVVNLFAWRATNPQELHRKADPVGPLNDESILNAVAGAGVVIAAWGTMGRLFYRDVDVCLRVLKDEKLHCLGLNKDGSPKHPLYLPNNAPLQDFSYVGLVPPLPILDLAATKRRIGR